MRRRKSSIHGTPSASRTGSAPVSQTSHAKTASATKTAARIMVAGAVRPAWTEGGLTQARPGSARPHLPSFAVNLSHNGGRDCARWAVERDLALAEADDAARV